MQLLVTVKFLVLSVDSICIASLHEVGMSGTALMKTTFLLPADVTKFLLEFFFPPINDYQLP